jgi:subtilisin family serine protease
MKQNTDNRDARPVAAYFLWHLAALNVIDASFSSEQPEDGGESALPVINSTVWDVIRAKAEKKDAEARIALIDTGISHKHPNLYTRVIAEDSIDFVTHQYGARFVSPDLRWKGPPDRELQHAFFAGLDLRELGQLGLSPFDQAYLEGFVTTLRESRGVVRRLLDNDEYFAAHGTACAGLMVAEPAAFAAGGKGPAAVTVAGATANADAGVLPYFGVDPFSRVFSVRTGFDPDAKQFIAAFLYAWMKGADVIVLPRGIPDPVRSRLREKENLSASLESYEHGEIAELFARLKSGAGDPDRKGEDDNFSSARGWDILKAVIIAVSRKIPIICAAGNDGESQAIYPACLAAEECGVISVGAITPMGYRAGYSNYGGLTLVAPSDDGEVLNRQQCRQEKAEAAESDLSPLPDEVLPGQQVIPFAKFSLVTTDLPGAFGYAQDGQRAVNRGTRNVGLYTEFGGTSGAASLIGGVAALMQRARRAAGLPALGGTQLREVLISACFVDRPVRPGIRTPAPDPMNMAIETHADLSEFFGAGLPDAMVAVGEALAYTE